MNAELVDTQLSDVITSVISDFREQCPYPYTAPSGFFWKKEPDTYDPENDIVWEGNWILARIGSHDYFVTSKSKKVKAKFEPDERFDVIKKQRMRIENTLNPDYHECRHVSHAVCTKSICCDWIWHEGECKFVSDDGNCGLAVRLGNQ